MISFKEHIHKFSNYDIIIYYNFNNVLDNADFYGN